MHGRPGFLKLFLRTAVFFPKARRIVFAPGRQLIRFGLTFRGDFGVLRLLLLLNLPLPGHMQAQYEAKQRHFMGLVSEQSLYNLKDRMIELEVIPACRDYGLGLIPWSPLAGGLLGGMVGNLEEGRRAGTWVQRSLKETRSQVEKYEAFCQELGQKPADVALAWLLSNPSVTAPIIGPRTMEQFEGNLGALEISLDEEALKRLDEIWPGPGGEAPEAFAW